MPYSGSAPRDLQSVAEAHTQLVRARLRVSGLFMALHAVQSPGEDRQTERVIEIARYMALMNDNFILEDNGDITVSRRTDSEVTRGTRGQR